MQASYDFAPRGPRGQNFPSLPSGGNFGRRLLVVSPHLDDAVFGCGNVIADHPGSTVVTVFAGGPSSCPVLTPWDAAAGFVPGENPLAKRREEDRSALLCLGARPIWLPFWDSQYRRPAEVEEIRARLEEVIREEKPDVVLIPFGLWHDDHRLAHEAAVGLVSRFPALEWLAYEDAIYRRFPDSGKAVRLEELRRQGIEPTWLAPGQPASEAKRRGISCYHSQLRALTAPGRPGWMDAIEPEICWALRSTGKTS